MRFMLIVKATEDSEAWKAPEPELMSAVGKFNQELIEAGRMLGGEGLLPSSRGARIRFENGQSTVEDGPFALPGLVSGFWLIQAASKEEALQWARRVPFRSGEIELRQISEPEDFLPEAFARRNAS